MSDTLKINNINREFDGILHKTSDYNMFNILLGNRFVEQKCVENLRKSMIKNGILPMPIIINEKSEVIDGQHRLAAISRLGGDVYYIIVPGLTLDDCISINCQQHSWSTLQFIYSKATQHIPQYEAMVSLIESNSDLSPSVVLNAMSNTKTNQIKAGNLKVADIHVGRQYLNCIRQIKTTMHKAAGPSTIDAFKAMYRQGANLDLLREAIEKNGAEKMKVNFGHSESAYIIFTEIYNKGRSANRINFTDYQHIPSDGGEWDGTK